MKEKNLYDNLITLIDPKKKADKEWFLSLLDDGKQAEYEEEHLRAVMSMLRLSHIRDRQKKIADAQNEIEQIKQEENNAENYCKITALLNFIADKKKEINSFKCFFEEPYFARMDLTDPVEGYNSYYIGKKGDTKLEIVDWRAPIARRYYQKSKISFSINEYDYKTVLRRSVQAKEGRVLDFKNEFLSVRDYLTDEEIGGRDEEILFDPYLKEILKSRKEENGIKDIIRTIQEKQYEIITCPDRENFVLQGCAGSGKTMVMLHRLSYLLYNNDGLKSRDVLMITPGDSFNDFIEELTEILELQRVRTTTVSGYFLQVLKNLKIEIENKIDYSQKESEEYLTFLYSSAFEKELKKKTDKVFDSLYGLFTGSECAELIADMSQKFGKQLSAYEQIKNSSLRIRRTVLGEIKEKKEGGLYYTKPFRKLMNCVNDALDFLSGTLKSENAKNQVYFYKQFLSFYKSAGYITAHSERICLDALRDLGALKADLQKEIADLKRYRERIGKEETFIYADRIANRTALFAETEKTEKEVMQISSLSTEFSEFCVYLLGEKNFSAIGKSADFTDVVRFFYRETVKKYKAEYKLTGKAMYPSDVYALTKLCYMLGADLTPKYAYVFVDEAQDISKGEFDLLKKINSRGAFNIFGDLKQNITPYRGVKDWTEVFDGYSVYKLNSNYRNTNQIVDYVSENLDVEMFPTGIDGPNVEKIASRSLGAFFKDKKGLKAVICTEKTKEKYQKKTYGIVSEKRKISKGKVNLLTVWESKGLEFSAVAVATEGMTDAEKYIAFTRALQNLAIVE